MAFLMQDDKGLIVLLTPENLARMKQGDPFTQPDLRLTICFEELPQERLLQALGGNPRKYLQRGWDNHPDDYSKWKKVGELRRG